MVRQSEEFKKSAVQKYHSRGHRTVQAVAREIGITAPLLYAWAKQYGTSGGMKKAERRPQDWSAAEKLKAVIDFEHLDPEKQGEFLRREGLHSEHLESWKKNMQSGLESGAGASVSRAEMNELKAENKELKRDLHRKNGALAETTALLVLKKKADLLWGTGESE